jgi:hypothetical protein
MHLREQPVDVMLPTVEELFFTSSVMAVNLNWSSAKTPK